MKKRTLISIALGIVAIAGMAQTIPNGNPYRFHATQNPIITHKHTADPAPFVKGDTLYLYTGVDFAGNQGGYKMHEWALFTTTDMMNWTEHKSPLHVDEFKWQNSHAAYAAHVAEKNGKYYFYVSTNWCGIGVAVADSPYGPFKDVLGKPLLTNADCPGTDHSWACIDPAIYQDEEGNAWIYWGNRRCFAAKLKPNMIEIDGEVMDITPEGSNFTEAPWVHKHNGKYYLTFATGWPEKLGYAIGDSPIGPFEYKGIFSEVAGNSNTTHPGIVEYKGKTILFTHNGALHAGTSYSRSVCAQELQYDKEGNIMKCDITTDGVPYLQEYYDRKAKEEKAARKMEKKMGAYLMVYHKDADHGLHMAISYDGLEFISLNEDKPLIAGDTIAEQKGIRDPHIFRGPDGAFYLAMTDLHVFGVRDGYRTTEWERDGHKYGWGNNRGLVLMKSTDLKHWTRTNLNFQKMGGQWAEVGCVWAPETCYDYEKGKLFLHFTTRFGNGRNMIYYVYMNDDFTAMESEPQLLFEAPQGKYNVIDSDIMYHDGTYHLFYVSHEGGATVKHATAADIKGPYTMDENYYDGVRQGHEAPNCWKRIGEDTWVVMHDNYRINPHNFGFTETHDFIHYTPLGNFGDGKMTRTNFAEQKHGAIIHITKKEAKMLEKYWNKK
jgi:hypothetical protein